MGDTVLLTGASGFVGRTVLAELVARGIRVHAVSRRPRPEQAGVIWHRADLLTEAGRASVAGLAPRLIHCAWEVEHGTFWTSPANEHWRTASLDLVQRFRGAGGGHVLALGTCAEYDAGAEGKWNEARAIAPSTRYGQAKAALHRDLLGMSASGLVWARLFHLYGLGEDRRRLIPALIDALRAGHPVEVRASELVRDYASTCHIARCLVDLMEADAEGPFDLGSGHPRALGDLARIVEKSVGAPAMLRLSHNPQKDDPAHMAPDLERLHTVIGRVHEQPEQALPAHIRRWPKLDV